ncbi:MAG TPA: DUF4157 domain-containing protein [Candidatus Solibacter sp.]|nr:DUF4157 domain-containing protein [Candidatus Solibacter sp.]
MLAGNRIQTKLAVGQPGDQFEQEADRIADQITHMPGRDLAPPALRHSADPTIAGELLSGLGAGQAIDPALRSQFESQLGHDFSAVRIYTGASAAESARAIGARAFTFKSDIVMDRAEFSPGTPSGRRLLAHELVHVAQQRAAAPVHGAAAAKLSKACEGVIQRDDKIPGWNFTPSDYATLVKAKKDLTIASDSGWVPKKLQENILNTLRYTLDPKLAPSATEGINIMDFYHGHLVVPKDVGISADASSKRSAFEAKEQEVEKTTLGAAGKPTKENVGAYSTALVKILPDFGAVLEEGVKIKGAAAIYHTFEFTTPSDLKKKGKSLGVGSTRRNFITPLATNVPTPYTPPDTSSASSYTQDYFHLTQFAFLVGPDGAVHVRPGTVGELSTVTGTPLSQFGG